MEDKTMKKDYIKPTCETVLMENETCLLRGSSTPPNEIRDYDDWME